MSVNRLHHDALQADIRPQTDGCNGLRYNLTADIIESIFRTYPAGKKIRLHFEVSLLVVLLTMDKDKTATILDYVFISVILLINKLSAREV